MPPSSEADATEVIRIEDGPSTAEASAVEATPATGLTATEAERRRQQGLANVVVDRNSRTVAQILRANVLTRFNAILGTLLVVILVVGDVRDGLFGIVLISNALIGIVQELRAKRTLDRLRLITAPTVHVVRDGAVAAVPPTAVVLGDLVELRSGDQVAVDGEVLVTSGLEVDESLLTGESDALHKQVGDGVLSGSAVVAGTGRILATAVGEDAYAARLASQAKEYAPATSELRAGIDLILRVATWFMGPAAVLLVITQLRSSESVGHALSGAVAGVVAMIPEGLVLLTSMAFALGAINLGRRQALVRELPAVETLARVDVVCVDKTGTLTEGHLRVAELRSTDPTLDEQTLRSVLGALAASDPNPNATLAAIAGAATTADGDPRWTPVAAVPFSSARKWSGVDLGPGGRWLLGAPDVLCPPGHPVLAQVEEEAGSGARVVLLARTDAPLAERGPDEVRPAALVVLRDVVRPDAAPTVAYFARQEVALKVISGDHPATVAAVAEAVGVPGADRPVDGRDLPDDLVALGELLEERSVFGRVQPDQKRAMVDALQARGHVVAMTGDGVNDVLALKHADMGVAMGSGSDATRAVAQLVLLDDSFASLPAVVGEGRRVIANVERVANLFVTKSVYSFLLAMLVGVAGLTFPFLPRHLTVVSSLTIGIPAFFLAFAPNQPRARPGFVRRVALFAGPAGLVAAVATFGGYVLADGPDVTDTHAEARTGAVIVLFLVAFWVLVILARPMTTARVALLAALGSAFVVALTVPWTQEFFALDPPSAVGLFAMIGVASVAIGVLEGGWRLVGWQREHLDAAEIIARVRRPLEALDAHAHQSQERSAAPTTGAADHVPGGADGRPPAAAGRSARRQTSS